MVERSNWKLKITISKNRAIKVGGLVEELPGPTEDISSRISPLDSLQRALSSCENRSITDFFPEMVSFALSGWSPSRHFLNHPGVRSRMHIAPLALWRIVCNFFRRADWPV